MTKIACMNRNVRMEKKIFTFHIGFSPPLCKSIAAPRCTLNVMPSMLFAFPKTAPTHYAQWIVDFPCPSISDYYKNFAHGQNVRHVATHTHLISTKTKYSISIHMPFIHRKPKTKLLHLPTFPMMKANKYVGHSSSSWQNGTNNVGTGLGHIE